MAGMTWDEICEAEQSASDLIFNDAYIAASAAGAGCRLVTRDGGFKRFPGLDWWNPAGRASP